MIDSTFHQNGLDAAVMIEKYRIKLSFFLLFALLLTFSCRSFNTHQGFSIELSKEYYYRTLVIANIDNNVALTRCCESCEVWPLKIKVTLLEFFC